MSREERRSDLLREALSRATDTELLVEGPSAIDEFAAVFKGRFGDRSAIIVSDEDTWEAIGRKVDRALESAGVPRRKAFVFPAAPTLHCEYGNVGRIVEELSLADAVPIAAGAGTINDLVKRASHEASRRYVCAASAASVDGYTSSGAAILKEGFKQTLPCPAPVAVVAEIGVLGSAPSYLTSSGYGDLASKLIAGADWLVADAVGADPIDEFAFHLCQEELRERLSAPDAVREGKEGPVLALFEGLAMTGFSMQYLKSSRPVSGCEHLFSHIWEMEDLSYGGRPVTHGHKVAIGTLAATAIYEVALRRLGADELAAGPAGLPSPAEREREVRLSFEGSSAAPGVVSAAVRVSLGKLDEHRAEERLTRAAEAWTRLKELLAAQLMSYAELRGALSAAGCPVRPADIGLERDCAIRTAFRAQMIRDRYSLLDLLYEGGLLNDCVDAVLADDRYLL